MDQKQSKVFEDFIYSFLGFMLALVGSVYYIFPKIEQKFQKDLSRQAPVAVALPSSPGPTARIPTKSNPEPAKVAAPKPRPSNYVANSKEKRSVKSSKPSAPSANAAVNAGLADAKRLIGEGRWQDAEPMLAEILKSEPGNADALIEMAMINLLDKRDNDQALPFMKRAIEADSENENMISELLTIYDEKGQAEEALDFFRKLNQAQPDSKAAEYGLAQALLRTGKKSEAVEHLQKSLEFREGWDKDETQEQLGDTYADLGMPDQALDAWREVIDRQKAHTEAIPEDKDYLREQNNGLRIKYAAQLIELGRFDEADSMIRELERDMPGDEYIVSLRKTLRQRRL